MGISIGIGGTAKGSSTAKISQQIVNELPETGNSGTIYFVRNSDSEEGNLYSEYLWVNNKWERFGDINPNDYYTKEELESLLDNQNKDEYIEEEEKFYLKGKN